MSGRLTGLASLAAENVAAHALGYAASSAGLVLSLMLWIAGTSVAEGLRAQALRAADASADIVVSATALGRHAPLEPALAERIRGLDGVEKVEARIVAAVDADPHPILVVAVEASRLQGELLLARGEKPKQAGDCLVGSALAHELGLYPGAHLALEGAITRVYTVSGILRDDDALGGSKAMIVELAEAQTLLGDARVSDLCVWTRAGYAEATARAIGRLSEGAVGIRAITRSGTRAAIEQAANRRSGGLSALLAPLLALATVTFATLSWFAHARRATEIAAYKLAGFSGGDILFVTAIENAIVALAVGCTAFLGAWIFVRVFDAPLFAPYLVADLELFPAQRIPASFTPLPLGLGLALAFSSTLAGSVLSTWRLSLARSSKAFA